MPWKRIAHALLIIGWILLLILGRIGTALMIIGSGLKGGHSADEQPRALSMPRKEYRPSR